MNIEDCYVGMKVKIPYGQHSGYYTWEDTGLFKWVRWGS